MAAVACLPNSWSGQWRWDPRSPGDVSVKMHHLLELSTLLINNREWGKKRTKKCPLLLASIRKRLNDSDSGLVACCGLLSAYVETPTVKLKTNV